MKGNISRLDNSQKSNENYTCLSNKQPLFLFGFKAKILNATAPKPVQINRNQKTNGKESYKLKEMAKVGIYIQCDTFTITPLFTNRSPLILIKSLTPPSFKGFMLRSTLEPTNPSWFVQPKQSLFWYLSTF